MDLIRQLIEPSESLRLFCIVAEPGAGKSTLAWRAAAELHRKHWAFVIRIKDNEDVDAWYRMADLIFILDAGRRDEWQEYKMDTTRDEPEDFDDRLALTFLLNSDGNYHPVVVQRGAFFWFLVTVLRKLGISKPFEYFPRSYALEELEFIEWSPEEDR